MRPNVVFVIVDCLRPDYLGCYRKGNIKTPFLDSIGAGGTIVRRSYTHCPLTGPAHLSIFSSQLPYRHGMRLNACEIKQDKPMMAQIFKENGYQTAGFVGAFVLNRRFGFDRGFDFYDDSMLDPYLEPLLFKAFGYYKEWGGFKLLKNSRNASRVSRNAIRWLKTRRTDKPFFMFLHYFDAHDHFRLPLPLHLLYFRGRNYKKSVEYTDYHFGRILRYLKQHNLFDNTIFVITSDHGESLNEYQFQGINYRGHSMVAYEVCLRTPLILCGPGIPKARFSEQTIRHIDILPTLLRLSSIPYPEGASFEGKDLSGQLKGQGTEIDLEVYAETLSPILKKKTPEWRILIDGKWKYVLKPQAGEESLYNLDTDPQEHCNIIGEHRDIAARLKKRLLAIIEGDDKFQVPDYEEKIKASLEALGYM